MPANNFLPFATAGDADVMSQAAYAILTARTEGFTTGIAQPAQLNKVWRQSAFIAAALAQTVSENLTEDVLDDGDLAGLVAKIKAAFSSVKAVRTITHATVTPTLTLGDGEILADTTAGDILITAPTTLVAAGLVKQVPVTMIGSGGYAAIITTDGTLGTEIGRIINVNDASGAGSMIVHLYNGSVRVTGNP